MVDIFIRLWDITWFPIYHITDDYLMGTLFYSLLIYWLLMTLTSLFQGFK